MAFNFPLDEKLTASINRRRIAEEQRKQRIFNARERTIGLDVKTLNRQVEEANFMKQKQQDEEKAFYNQINLTAKYQTLLEKQHKEEIRKLNQDIDNFRLSQQKPEHRRDFDLYDPHLKKKELPPRISDDDPRCSISGLQKLEGEDLDYKYRTKAQKDQIGDILLQQMLEKQLMNRRQNEMEKNWMNKIQQLDNQASQLAKLEQAEKRSIFTATSDYNKNLDLQVKERRRQQEAQEKLDNLKDMCTNYYGDLLSENPSVARSAFGPHRVVPDRWKGMSKEQLEEYHKGQKQQIFDNKRQKEHEAIEKSKWEQNVLTRAKYELLLRRDQQRQLKELEKKNAEQNSDMAQEQRLRQDYVNKIVYSNTPSEEYYQQFNTSTR